MDRALDLAAQGPRGANPLVGAVIVSQDGTLLGEGWHHGAGTPHAEPTALADAHARGNDVTGAHMYVTLEPCNHTGRTGPCTEAILAAGIASVSYAASDTTDKASGGASYLQSRGVAVDGGIRAAESERLNERWRRSMAEGRPFVTAKFATSLDFSIAAADGTSQWITSEDSRRHAQTLRSQVDAIIVGTGTVAADNPRLTARDSEGREIERQPLRVAMGLRDIPDGASIRGADGRFRHLRTHDPADVLAQLAGEGVSHVMLEGGPSILGAFLQSDLIDEYWHYQAPLYLPGGRVAFTGADAASLADGTRLVLDDVKRIGPDLFIRSSPAPAGQQHKISNGIN
jgi:diaminohydroxyphosphoribosylaminopyrimidine deaminase/5-amino-6-(5-phosphoribosylamino)uracil reductase